MRERQRLASELRIWSGLMARHRSRGRGADKAVEIPYREWEQMIAWARNASAFLEAEDSAMVKFFPGDESGLSGEF